MYDQDFYGGGGGAGVVDGDGSNSDRCFEWGGGGSLRNLSKNILTLPVQKYLVPTPSTKGRGGFSRTPQ